MINRGSSSGVALMPVITPGGIVGRVVAVSPVTAQVMLITDEKAAAGAIVGQLGSSVRRFGRGLKFRIGGNALRLRIAESRSWRLHPDDGPGWDLPGGLERRRSH